MFFFQVIFVLSCLLLDFSWRLWLFGFSGFCGFLVSAASCIQWLCFFAPRVFFAVFELRVGPLEAVAPNFVNS